jgi:hypothetical protein
LTQDKACICWTLNLSFGYIKNWHLGTYYCCDNNVHNLVNSNKVLVWCVAWAKEMLQKTQLNSHTKQIAMYKNTHVWFQIQKVHNMHYKNVIIWQPCFPFLISNQFSYEMWRRSCSFEKMHLPSKLASNKLNMICNMGTMITTKAQCNDQ